MKRLPTIFFPLLAVTLSAQQTGTAPQSGGWPRADQPVSTNQAQSNGGWTRFTPQNQNQTSAQTPQSQPADQPQPVDQPQRAQGQNAPSFDQGQPNMPQNMGAPPPSQLTLPAGTWITVRVNQPLSSDHNQVGDAFTVTLTRPIVSQGFIVARRGETIGGRVAEVSKGGRVKGVSKLGLELTDLTAADGQQIPLKVELIQHSAGTSVGRDAAAIGTTTGVGAAIGAGVNGGVGAGVGAAAGLVVGTLGVLTTRGRPAVVYPEETLTFRTTAPMTIATDRAPQAFLPVSQQDYEPRMMQRRVGPPSAGPGVYGSGYGPYGPPPPYYSPYAYGPYYGFGYPYYYGPSIYFRGGFGGFGRFRR